VPIQTTDVTTFVSPLGGTYKIDVDQATVGLTQLSGSRDDFELHVAGLDAVLRSFAKRVERQRERMGRMEQEVEFMEELRVSFDTPRHTPRRGGSSYGNVFVRPETYSNTTTTTSTYTPLDFLYDQPLRPRGAPRSYWPSGRAMTDKEQAAVRALLSAGCRCGRGGVILGAHPTMVVCRSCNVQAPRPSPDCRWPYE